MNSNERNYLSSLFKGIYSSECLKAKWSEIVNIVSRPSLCKNSINNRTDMSVRYFIFLFVALQSNY